MTELMPLLAWLPVLVAVLLLATAQARYDSRMRRRQKRMNDRLNQLK